MKVLIIDPPEGWRYGFPKPVHEEFHTLGSDFDLGRWLISEGYPEKDIKTSGIKIRGTGAATKGVMARGPMA